MPRWLKYLLLLAAFLLIAAVPLAYQLETSSVEGLVTDDQGPVVSASIELRNGLAGFEYHAESDTSGYYRIENVRPGRYALQAKAAGHDSVFMPHVVVEHGRTVYENIYLPGMHSIGF